jgi:peptide/nickel transport system substrate-binding protein
MVLVLSLFAAACGGSGGDEGGGSDGGGGDDTESAGTPTPGGKVVYGLEAENSEGWCMPEAQLAIAGIQVGRAIYDTLTAPNEDAEYVPFLAKTITSNPEFTEWTLTLREGVTFHDGTPLDATVVKNNLDAFRGKYPARSPLLFVFVFQNIADVAVVDPMTVKITTSTPWASLPAALYGSGRIGIMAQAQLDDATTCDRNLIGTGPFKLVEWNQNESFLAEKNPDYWQTDADGQQLPYLDEIEFRPIIEAASRVNGLLSGEVNAIQVSAGEQIDDLRTETEAGNINSVESDQFAEVTFAQFNTSKAPFDSKTARMAAIKSMDMETFNQTRNLGILQNANGPFAPGGIGYLEDSGYPTYDLEGAKELVAQYKAETGEDLAFTLLSTPDQPTQQSAQLAQQMGEKAGIKVSIQTMEQAALISTAIAGDFQAMVFRNYPGGDPDAQYNWWKSKSPVNFARFSDPEIDTLLDQGRATADKDQRQQIYGDINKRFASEGYSMWLQWVMWDIGTATDVHGVLGPDLPDDQGGPFPGLATGHPVAGMWVDQG